jgi:hypothetical protein
MLRILQDEGFDICMRELTRVRSKHRWLLRVPTEVRNKKTQPIIAPPPQSVENAGSEEDVAAGDNSGGIAIGPDAGVVGTSMAVELDPAEQAWREERKRAMAIESAEKWATKKRRRRTRVWGGMPADPPGPPRFPSETTLEDSKTILGLDPDLYKDFRQRFQVICEGAGVIKKTIAGPEKWEAVKEQLVREMPHLRSLLWDKEGMDSKKLAIDVICCDVTKRMRIIGKKMTLAQAKNVLGLNPEEAREVLFAFYRILVADKFTGKLEVGEEHWNQLMRNWVEGSELLQRVLASEDAGHSREERIKAKNVLARDVRKRYRDDLIKGRLDRAPPARSASAGSGSEQAAEPEIMDDGGFSDTDSPQVAQLSSGRSPGTQRGHRAPEHAHTQARLLPSAVMAAQPDLSSIDPGLGSSMLLATEGQPSYVGQQQQPYAQQYRPLQPAPVYHQPSATPTSTIAIYFRLQPGSTITAIPPMWISTLSSRSVEELRNAAVTKFPGALCLAIEGLVKDGKGGEVPLQIDGDAELEAYLAHVQDTQGTPSFSVQLVRGWNTG